KEHAEQTMMDKATILFVDDHQEVINGLNRICRSMRHQWKPFFALGGEQAIEMISRQKFDLLVTDISMPSIDGVEVLKKGEELQPAMIRMVLSGQYDMAHAIASGWPVHRYLNKPCPSEILTDTIQQALKIRLLLTNHKLQQFIGQAKCLPSLPRIYLAIEQELKKEHASLDHIGKIISSEITMTAKILQLANSPFFSRGKPINSVAQAVIRLGLDIIKALTLHVHACSDTKIIAGASIEEITEHSIMVGKLASAIAEFEGRTPQSCADAFMAGVLHNIGTLLISSTYSCDYADAMINAHQNKQSIWQSEQEILGADHAMIGGYLINLWGVPSAIVKAVAYHIQPSLCPDNTPPFALTAVHAANAIIKSSHDNDKSYPLDSKHLAHISMLGRVAKWRELYQEMAIEEATRQ
ncbi:MAG: HDOD domain-containing protein, partial [Mariprofundus sp.]|nr:HDOD domain-containing protein [Mariprofundus sp.]